MRDELKNVKEMQISGRMLLACAHVLDDIPYQIEADKESGLDVKTAKIVIGAVQSTIDAICFYGENPKDYIHIRQDLKELIDYTLNN
jgi:hypothetical protein